MPRSVCRSSHQPADLGLKHGFPELAALGHRGHDPAAEHTGPDTHHDS
jgi:hypothetical protein